MLGSGPGTKFFYILLGDYSFINEVDDILLRKATITGQVNVLGILHYFSASHQFYSQILGGLRGNAYLCIEMLWS